MNPVTARGRHPVWRWVRLTVWTLVKQGRCGRRAWRGRSFVEDGFDALCAVHTTALCPRRRGQRTVVWTTKNVPSTYYVFALVSKDSCRSVANSRWRWCPTLMSFLRKLSGTWRISTSKSRSTGSAGRSRMRFAVWTCNATKSCRPTDNILMNRPTSSHKYNLLNVMNLHWTYMPMSDITYRHV